jgi:hypothetical protein
MKRLLIGLLTSLMISLGLSYFLGKYYLDPKLLEVARQKGAEALGVPLQIQGLTTRLFPLQLELENIKFEEALFGEAKASASIGQVHVSIDFEQLLSRNLGLILEIEELNAQLVKGPEKEKEKEKD